MVLVDPPVTQPTKTTTATTPRSASFKRVMMPSDPQLQYHLLERLSHKSPLRLNFSRLPSLFIFSSDSTDCSNSASAFIIASATTLFHNSTTTLATPSIPLPSPEPQQEQQEQKQSSKPNQLKQKMSLYNIRLYGDDRPPSPLALTSTIAPPSLMPATAAGISAKSPVTSSSKQSARHSVRRTQAENLKIPMPLARYNPPSSSPTTHINNARNGISTGSDYHRDYASLTQKKLQEQQRDFIMQATRGTSIPPRVISPRLIPLGSPGGVMTPLMLEQEREEGYFVTSSAELYSQRS